MKNKLQLNYHFVFSLDQQEIKSNREISQDTATSK